MRAITFRPRVEPKKLKEIAKGQHYSDLSGFINDAIKEKILSYHANPRDEKLVGAIKKAVYEYNGWNFTKPDASEAAAIKTRAAAMRAGKVKSIPLDDVMRKLERMK